MTRVTIMKSGYIDCHEKSCFYRQSCANHETAGDFRYEDGISPEFVVFDDGTLECQTTFKNPNHKYDNIPEGDYDIGAVKLEDGKIVKCEQYSD
jgi:hypothetical protein